MLKRIPVPKVSALYSILLISILGNSGVVRLKATEQAGALKFPMFDVNDAQMKHFFDNRYGSGVSYRKLLGQEVLNTGSWKIPQMTL